MLWRKTFIHLISSISKRKKLSVSMRNQTSDLLIPGFKPLSLSQRGSLTRILHTATISNVENVIFVNRQEKIYIILYHFLGLKIYHLSYLKGCLMFSVNLGKSDVPPYPMASLRQIHSLSCLVYGGELWYVSLLNRRYFLFLCEQS